MNRESKYKTAKNTSEKGYFVLVMKTVSFPMEPGIIAGIVVISLLLIVVGIIRCCYKLHAEPGVHRLDEEISEISEEGQQDVEYVENIEDEEEEEDDDDDDERHDDEGDIISKPHDVEETLL